MICRSIALLVVFLAPTIAFAQTGLRFSNLSVSNGLSQNTINAIAEDQHGFLWFATQDGLNRYDGRRVELWPMYGIGQPLSDRFVTTVVCSGEGAIWAGTRHGLNRIDANRGSLQTFFTGSRPYHDAVDQLVAFQSGVAVNHSGVLYLVHDTCTSYATARKWTGSRVMALASDGQNIIIADEVGRVLRWDGLKQEVLHELDNEVITGLKVQDNELWAWTDKHLISWSSGLKRQWPITGGFKITAFIQDGDHKWVGTTRGLHLLTDEGIVALDIPDQSAEALAFDYIGSLWNDRFGGLWVGTTRFGAFRHDEKAAQVLHFPGKYFADPVVWATLLVGDQLFVGSTAGLDRFTVSKGWNETGLDPMKHMRHEERWTGFHTSALVWHENRVWVGTRNSGLRALKKNGSNWQFDESLQNNDMKVIYAIDASNSGQLAISTATEVFMLAKGGFDSFRLTDVSLEAVTSNYNHHVFASKDTLWLCSTSGLHRVELPHFTYSALHAGTDSSQLPFEVTSAVQRGRDGHIWVATFGGGVCRLSADGARVEERFTQEHGLLNSVVYGLVETDDGWILSTNNGLSLLNNDGLIRNFTPRAGIPFGEHSQNAFGMLDELPWFGGIDGFYIVQPSFFTNTRGARTLVIDEMRVNYQTVHPADRQHFLNQNSDQRKIQLFPGDNSLSLNVRLPGYVNDQVKVFYRMQGVIDNWVELDRASDQIHFTTLPGGDYLLEFSRSDSGDSEIQLEQWKIHVIPPVTQQLWFFILIGFLLTGTTYAVVKYNSSRRLRVEILKREAVERVKRERERISMDLHDNIGAQITHVITRLDNLSYAVAAGRAQDPEQALDNLSDFARGTMQQLRDTIWTLSQEDIVLDEFIDRVRDYMARVLDSSATHKLNIRREEGTNVILPHEATVQLFRVLQEALNNAMKYSQAQNFELGFSIEKQRLIIEFSDDGVGFDLSDEHDKIAQGHYGLRNMRMRMERMGAEFEISTRSGEGCRIWISLPLDTVHPPKAKSQNSDI